MNHSSIQIHLSLSNIENPFLNKDSSIGSCYLNIAGFLNLLETRLGVNSPDTSFTNRLVDYLDCIERTKNPAAFYQASYKQDPFSVARKLLLWRDELYMAGWTGSFSKKVSLSKRLIDIESIETLANPEVSKNIGQRFQYILERLKHDTVFISQVILHDDLDHFPPLVKKVIEAIGANLQRQECVKASAIDGTDLAQLQNIMTNSMAKSEFSNDGSVLLIETDDIRSSYTLSSHIIGAAYSDNKQEGISVLCENDGQILDECLESIGLPRAGFSQNSSWRPVFQVMPLSMELLWNPVNPTKILQFLSNPVCPLSGAIRYPLAQTMAETPGLGSQSWHEKIEKIIAKEDTKKDQEAIKKSIKFWIENARYDPEKGAPVSVIITRLNALSNWLGNVMSLYSDKPEQQLYATAKGQTEDLLSAVNRLQDYNDGSLSRDHIRRLIDDIKGVGAPVIDRQAGLSVELKPLQKHKQPGSVIKPSSLVLWNGLDGNRGIIAKDWSDAEIEALEDNNIIFLSDDASLKKLAHERSKPVINAKKKLILIASKDRSSDHLLWTQILCLCNGLKPISETQARELLKIKTRETSPLNLPLKKREWQLPKSAIIPTRSYSSYSSLDKFIFKPHQWVLSYAAKLRGGSLLITNEGNLLKGNLAHRLIEIYLEQHSDIQSIKLKNIHSWTDKALNELIEKEGATLLEEGAFRDRVAFISIMKTALKNLITHLIESGVVKTKTEFHVESEFMGGALQGSIDIIVTNKEGVDAIIDVKFGGLKYRRDEIRSSKYLQLLTYDRLLQTKPHLSFFIISNSHMLNLSHNFFKRGERVDPELGLTNDQYWSDIETLWNHRRKHFDNGLIEVTIEGTEPTARSLPEGITIEVSETNDAYSEYTALTGWEPNA